ncbi:interleukin-6 receptor subunit beta isoform X2 [Coregonus clupeaformis]|uniref:interleukin-6 receptor subunit beta isoform X2 n=1 Tax=Coregonus clupeaformis TaxID=59861 RepID=UPI001BE10D38|nr:interleukin-6 receptor subunit beta isoform X2 [Coregonus clupeaformis]
MEAKEHWFLQGFLVLATVIAQGATSKCPSSPLCYKKTETATTYTCEWVTSESMKNVTYELFYRRSNSSENRTSLGRDRKSYICVNDNTVINKVPVDIWVVASMGNWTCQSLRTSVILSERVKYEAPQSMSMSRSSSNLTLSWDNKKVPEGAVIEVRFRRLGETSGTWTFKTEVKQAIVTLENLQNQSVYQLQVRQKSKLVKHPLWSDWTPILDVPPEIQNPPEVNWTVKDFNNGTRLLKLTWGTPPYPVSMQVNYNLSLHIWPCLLKRKNFTNVTTTEFSVYVTYSAVSGDIVAFNKVGKSSPTHILVPAKHLTFPSKSWPDDKLIPFNYSHGFAKSCLEWYKLTDGETRPEKVNRSKLNGAVNEKLKSIRLKMDDYVRYYYLVHKQTDGKPQTTEMCLMYKEQGAPSKAPILNVNVTTNSAMLHWKPIPVPDQQGFLTHYEVCYTKRNQTECHNISASKTEYLVQNLTPGSMYIIHLAGATAVGLGPRTTIHIVTKLLPQSIIGWIIAGIIVLIAILITVCLFIIKRHKIKIFPPIPHPVVEESVNYRARNQDMYEMEEVHELQLHDNCSQDPNPEEATVLEVSETYECEDMDEKCLGDSSTPVSDPLSPDHKGQVLHLETTDPSQGEIDCEVTMLMYRNGLVFDMKAYSTEDVGTPL